MGNGKIPQWGKLVHGFYLGSIPGQGKIMNVSVFYHEVNVLVVLVN